MKSPTHNSALRQQKEEWLLIYNGELAGIFDSHEGAARAAALRFRTRDCLIRRIGAPGFHARHGCGFPASLRRRLRALRLRLLPSTELPF